MPQKKTQDKTPSARVSTPRVKTASPAPIEQADQMSATAPAKAKMVASKPAASRAKKTEALAATASLLKLNGAVNGHASAAQIAERAYFLWLEKGCPEGTADQDWVEAERLLTAH